MGRIKSSGIKKAARTLAQKEGFSENFVQNKKSLETYELPDKGTRNKIAGYISRLKKAENKQEIVA